MRISIVTETWPPEINGVALTARCLALGLQALGHAVEVVRPRQGDEAAAGLPTLLLPGAALPRYPGLRFGLPAQRRLHEHWSRQRPDALYVATEGPLGLTALAAAARLGIPVSTGFHTRFDDFARHYGLKPLAPLVFSYLRRFHNRADATLVPTRELADFLAARGFRNVQVLRRAVDTTLFHPDKRSEVLRADWGLTPGQLAVLHVGRLAPEKNLELVLTAYRAIQRQVADARLIVVGDGPARAALAAANPDVLFAGVRRGEELASHYASGDLFLFPSLTETFGNVTLEALASGVPVVAFDYGAAREHMPTGCGWRVPFGDGGAFVAAAAAGAVCPTLRTGQRAAARAATEGLDPTGVSASLARLLSELRNEPRAA